MTASRTVLALAAAAALGSGLAWSPLASAQSSAASPQPSATRTAPAAPAPSATAPSSPSLKAADSAPAPSAKAAPDTRVEARITQLHKQLKITPDQENDWHKLAQDMRDNARDMSRLIRERADAGKGKPLNAVDNLKSYQKITDAHAEGLKKITPDFEKLYNAMSPAQKKTADTVFNQRVNQRVRTTATPSSGNHS